MNDVEVDLEKISKILKKAIDLGGEYVVIVTKKPAKVS